jgi:chemotaxis signal transduction protein
MQAIRANYGRLMVVQSATSKLAFPADEVQGPHRFHPQELKDPPATLARTNARYAQSVLPWEKHAVGLMNAELLLSTLSTNLT